MMPRTAAPRCRSGFSVVEVLLATILLALIIGAVVHSFMSGGKSSKAIMNNLVLNENAQRIVDFVTNDVRECNLITATMPAFVGTTEVENLKTDGAGFPANSKNGIEITQMTFKSDAAAAGLANQSLKRITYALEKDFPNDSSPWVLYRSEVELDPNTKAEVGTSRRKKAIAENLESCLFYRISDSTNPGISGARNIYFRFKLREREKDTTTATKQRFANEVISIVNMRGGDL